MFPNHRLPNSDWLICVLGHSDRRRNGQRIPPIPPNMNCVARSCRESRQASLSLTQQDAAICLTTASRDPPSGPGGCTPHGQSGPRRQMTDQRQGSSLMRTSPMELSQRQLTHDPCWRTLTRCPPQTAVFVEVLGVGSSRRVHGLSPTVLSKFKPPFRG